MVLASSSKTGVILRLEATATSDARTRSHRHEWCCNWKSFIMVLSILQSFGRTRHVRPALGANA